MLDLRDVLELVIEGCNQGPFTESQLVHEGEELILPALAQLSHELDSACEERRKEGVRDRALIAEGLAVKCFYQLRDRLATIDIGGGEPAR